MELQPNPHAIKSGDIFTEKNGCCNLCKMNPMEIYSSLCSHCRKAVRERWKRRFFGIK